MLDVLLFLLICVGLSWLLWASGQLEPEIFAVLGGRELSARAIARAISLRRPDRQRPSLLVLQVALFWMEHQGYLASRLESKSTNLFKGLFQKRLYRRTGSRRPAPPLRFSPRIGFAFSSVPFQ